MAANLKFVLEERENLRRVRENFASIIEKYNHHFEDDTVISMNDLSVVTGKDNLKKYKTKHFGYSKLKTRRKGNIIESYVDVMIGQGNINPSEKSFFSKSCSSLGDETLKSGIFKKDVELNSSGETCLSTDNLTVSSTYDHLQGNNRNRTYHVPYPYSHSPNTKDIWRSGGNSDCSPDRNASDPKIGIDEASVSLSESVTENSDGLDNSGTYLSLQGNYQGVLSFIDSDTEEPSDAETLVTSSDSSVYSDDDLSDSGFNTQSQTTGYTWDDEKEDEKDRYKDEAKYNSEAHRIRELRWNPHRGDINQQRDESAFRSPKTSCLPLRQDLNRQSGRQAYHDAGSYKREEREQVSYRKDPKIDYHLIVLSSDEDETDLMLKHTDRYRGKYKEKITPDFTRNQTELSKKQGSNGGYVKTRLLHGNSRDLNKFIQSENHPGPKKAFNENGNFANATHRQKGNLNSGTHRKNGNSNSDTYRLNGNSNSDTYRQNGNSNSDTYRQNGNSNSDTYRQNGNSNGRTYRENGNASGGTHRYSNGHQRIYEDIHYMTERHSQRSDLHHNIVIRNNRNNNVPQHCYHSNLPENNHTSDLGSYSQRNDCENIEPNYVSRIKANKRLKQEKDYNYRISSDQAMLYLEDQDPYVASMKSPTSFRRMYMSSHLQKPKFEVKSDFPLNSYYYSDYDGQGDLCDEPDGVSFWNDPQRVAGHRNMLVDKPSGGDSRTELCRHPDSGIHPGYEDCQYNVKMPENRGNNFNMGQYQKWNKPYSDVKGSSHDGNCSCQYVNSTQQNGRTVYPDTFTKSPVKLHPNTERLLHQRTHSSDQLNQSDWASPKGKLGKVYCSASDLTDVSLLSNFGGKKSVQKSTQQAVGQESKPYFYSSQSRELHHNYLTNCRVSMSVPPKLIDSKTGTRSLVREAPELHSKQMSWNDKVLRWMSPSESAVPSERLTLKAKRRLQLIPVADNADRENENGQVLDDVTLSKSSEECHQETSRQRSDFLQSDGYKQNSVDFADLPKHENESITGRGNIPSSPILKSLLLRNQDSPSTSLSRLRVSSPHSSPRQPQTYGRSGSSKQFDSTGSLNLTDSADMLDQFDSRNSPSHGTGLQRKSSNSLSGKNLFGSYTGEKEDVFKKPQILASWRNAQRKAQSPAAGDLYCRSSRSPDTSPRTYLTSVHDGDNSNYPLRHSDHHGHRSPSGQNSHRSTNFLASSSLVSSNGMTKVSTPRENRSTENKMIQRRSSSTKTGIRSNDVVNGNSKMWSSQHPKGSGATNSSESLHRDRNRTLHRDKHSVDMNSASGRKVIQSTPLKPNVRLCLNDTISTICHNESATDSSDEEIVTISEF